MWLPVYKMHFLSCLLREDFLSGHGIRESKKCIITKTESEIVSINSSPPQILSQHFLSLDKKVFPTQFSFEKDVERERPSYKFVREKNKFFSSVLNVQHKILFHRRVMRKRRKRRDRTEEERLVLKY